MPTWPRRFNRLTRSRDDAPSACPNLDERRKLCQRWVDQQVTDNIISGLPSNSLLGATTNSASANRLSSIDSSPSLLSHPRPLSSSEQHAHPQSRIPTSPAVNHARLEIPNHPSNSLPAHSFSLDEFTPQLTFHRPSIAYKLRAGEHSLHEYHNHHYTHSVQRHPFSSRDLTTLPTHSNPFPFERAMLFGGLTPDIKFQHPKTFIFSMSDSEPERSPTLCVVDEFYGSELMHAINPFMKNSDFVTLKYHDSHDLLHLKQHLLPSTQTHPESLCIVTINKFGDSILLATLNPITTNCNRHRIVPPHPFKYPHGSSPYERTCSNQSSTFPLPQPSDKNTFTARRKSDQLCVDGGRASRTGGYIKHQFARPNNETQTERSKSACRRNARHPDSGTNSQRFEGTNHLPSDYYTPLDFIHGRSEQRQVQPIVTDSELSPLSLRHYERQTYHTWDVMGEITCVAEFFAINKNAWKSDRHGNATSLIKRNHPLFRLVSNASGSMEWIQSSSGKELASITYTSDGISFQGNKCRVIVQPHVDFSLITTAILSRMMLQRNVQGS